jgi:hypothetical protein
MHIQGGLISATTPSGELSSGKEDKDTCSEPDDSVHRGSVRLDSPARSSSLRISSANLSRWVTCTCSSRSD